MNVKPSSTNSRFSPLLPYLVHQNMPDGMLEHLLVHVLQEDRESFDKFFGDILQQLAQTLTHLNLSSEAFYVPYVVLSELCYMRVDNNRPICSLVRGLPFLNAFESSSSKLFANFQGEHLLRKHVHLTVC